MADLIFTPQIFQFHSNFFYPNTSNKEETAHSAQQCIVLDQINIYIIIANLK